MPSGGLHTRTTGSPSITTAGFIFSFGNFGEALQQVKKHTHKEMLNKSYHQKISSNDQQYLTNI